MRFRTRYEFSLASEGLPQLIDLLLHSTTHLIGSRQFNHDEDCTDHYWQNHYEADKPLQTLSALILFLRHGTLLVFKWVQETRTEGGEGPEKQRILAATGSTQIMLVAVILICTATLAPEACTRSTALNHVETKVNSELTSLRDGQAFGAEAFGTLKAGTIMRITCERSDRP